MSWYAIIRELQNPVRLQKLSNLVLDTPKEAYTDSQQSILSSQKGGLIRKMLSYECGHLFLLNSFFPIIRYIYIKKQYIGFHYDFNRTWYLSSPKTKLMTWRQGYVFAVWHCSIIHDCSKIAIKQAGLIVIKYTPLIKIDFPSKIYSLVIWVKDCGLNVWCHTFTAGFIYHSSYQN